MNSERTRRAADNAVDAGQRTPAELEPMYNNRANSTDTDGQCGARSTAKRSIDGDEEDQDGVGVEGESNWKTIGDILERFAGDTSLLGVPRAILATSRWARVFWVVVVVTCMAMFIEGCAQQLTMYFSYPKQVTDCISTSNITLTFYGCYR